MMRYFTGIYILISFSTAVYCQQAKNMILTLPSQTMPGKFYAKPISVYNYYFNDSITDPRLLNSFKYLPPPSSGSYYILYAKDSLRCAATISRKGNPGVYTVTHYETNGEVMSIARYDENNLPVGTYEEFFPGQGYKVYGKYKDGKETGNWWTYDEKGNATLLEIYENGKVVKTNFYRDPPPNDFTRKHHAPEPMKYTIGAVKNRGNIVLNDSLIEKELHPVLSLSGSMYDMDLAQLSGLNYMLGKPADLTFLLGLHLHYGKRNGFFATASFEPGWAKKASGNYTNFGNVTAVKVSNSFSHYSIIGNYPVYGKGKNACVFASAGFTLGHLSTESKFDSGSNPNNQSYFLQGKATQTFFHIGGMFDLLPKGPAKKFMYSLALKLGYDIALGKPKWSSASSTAMPDIVLSGFSFGICINSWMQVNKN